MSTTVTALLVSHDGARWLPAVLDGLQAQTRPPDRFVAVDTGSSDASAELLGQRLGADVVHRLPESTGYGAAVAAALDRAVAPEDSAWVWLLHDDSAPHPDALARLLDAAENRPDAAILGPKLREWPSLRRLLEVGVTITGTGSRETGLERGEYDQGQHDRMADVLAVNTAGMLVRRSVLESLGFDLQLPVFGNDLDFGWRAARAGHHTVVVPDAVVFHVEAAHRGVRRTPLTGGRVRRSERAAALYVLLVNAPAGSLPLRWVRLLLGSVARAFGLLLVRAPGDAVDELMALASVYARPARIITARRRRRRSATVPHRDVKHLLAPFWVPYRHGLDFVTDLGAALAHEAADVSSARRARSPAARAPLATDTGPVPAEAQNLPEDSGAVARLVTDPAAVVLLVLFLVSVWNARGLVGGGMLSGGALLPAPDTSAHWWSSYLASGHDLGTGSAAPAAPYLVPLALAGAVLLGKAWLVVDLLMLLCVPLAALGARRLLSQLTGSRWAALWGAVGYGLLPVLGGSVQQGRIGTVAVTVTLPWLVHAALFLHPARSPDRRARAAWRTALWLALA
ncbi:MAG: glycosyltransferase family 2 protein, partial [Nocardioidaceae bacterium]|nr:glycosyltransferase family 2 protein [Nocardioidaceae bacterium]